MRIGFKTVAMITLGLGATIPAFAQAAHAPEHRVETRERVEPARTSMHADRAGVQENRTTVRDSRTVTRGDSRDIDLRSHEDVRFVPAIHDEIAYASDPDFDVAVALNQLPPAVIATAETEANGVIESAQYIRQGASLFYDVEVAGPYHAVQTLRIGVNGQLLGLV